MRVLHLISSGGFFGAENVLVNLANEQKKQGLAVSVGVFDNAKNSHLEIVQKAQKYKLFVKTFPCRGRFDLSTIIRIRNFIKLNNIDIIHSHGYKSNFYAIPATVNIGIKRVTTCHNWIGKSAKMRVYKWLDKILLNRFDKVVVVSEVLRDEVLAGGIAEEKVAVIYNGIDIEDKEGTEALRHGGTEALRDRGTEGERYKGIERVNKIRGELGIKDDEKVIGTVGRLTIEKGHTYLLKAFKKVVLEFPDVRLLIVGDGPLMETLQVEVGSLNLEDKVIFTGLRNDIPDILCLMDIFVMPSLIEGMPMALLEAMAAKKPIIATKVGAIPKVIEDTYSGILIEPKDEIKLVGAMIKLLKDEKLSNLLAKNVFESVKNKFSSVKMTQNYIKTYQSLFGAT